MATAMIREGHFDQTAWAATLGNALSEAETEGAPDTEDTYFKAALHALETLSEAAGIPGAERTKRKSDWEAAYRRTPHGEPVLLRDD